MQTLTITDRVVIDDYYHMTTMDDMNRIQLVNLFSFSSLKLRAPFCTVTFTSNS